MSTASVFRDRPLAGLPTPAKALVTCIIVTMAFGMLGAVGQIIVHDIIPTFYADPENSKNPATGMDHEGMEDIAAPAAASGRGDLFSKLAPIAKKAEEPFYQGERFVWTLRWSHIHLFGMNAIFILLGIVTFLLDAGIRLRTWLIVLPFVGVLIDILSMWLKNFVSPAFFWLHIPGGGVFGLIFAYVSLRAFWEMWIKPAHGLSTAEPGT